MLPDVTPVCAGTTGGSRSTSGAGSYEHPGTRRRHLTDHPHAWQPPDRAGPLRPQPASLRHRASVGVLRHAWLTRRPRLRPIPRERGTGHQAALRQLGNRLVGILHGCLKPEPPTTRPPPGPISTPALDTGKHGMSAADNARYGRVNAALRRAPARTRELAGAAARWRPVPVGWPLQRSPGEQACWLRFNLFPGCAWEAPRLAARPAERPHRRADDTSGHGDGSAEPDGGHSRRRRQYPFRRVRPTIYLRRGLANDLLIDPLQRQPRRSLSDRQVCCRPQLAAATGPGKVDWSPCLNCGSGCGRS